LLKRFFKQVTVLGIVVRHRGFLIRGHHSQGLRPALPFPLGHIERFLAWHIPPWSRSVVQPQQVLFTPDVPQVCWGFLALCSEPLSKNPASV
jgi:hypothetical protein